MRIIKNVGLFLSITLLFITCDEETTRVNDELKDAPKLTFSKLTVDKQDVTKEQLLQQIQEKEKEGFTIRKITISDAAFAEVKGTAPNFSLKIKKAGTFTITLTLRKEGFKDVTIQATIVYIATEALTFDKLTTAQNTLSKDDILNQVQGNKDGFTIKSITVSDSNFAEVQGTAPNLSLKIKKLGTFKITLTLQKKDYKDVTLEATIVHVAAGALTFDKLTTAQSTLSKADILNQVKGNKDGFTLKSITIGNSYQSFAEVQGTAPNLSLKIKKLGTFKITLTLQKTGL